MENNQTIKVSSNSNANSVAGMIASLLKQQRKIEMYAVGAGAINQAVKAIAIARGFVAPSGVDLICVPAFTDVNVQNETRTGMKLIVKEI